MACRQWTIRPERFWEQFYQCSGRLNRKRYLKRQLTLVGLILFFVVCWALFVKMSVTDKSDAAILILGAVSLSLAVCTVPGIGFLTVAGYSLVLRRIHDLGHSELCLILTGIPFVNLLFMLYLFFARGTAGDNRYGPDPLEVGCSYVLEWAPASVADACTGKEQCTAGQNLKEWKP